MDVQTNLWLGIVFYLSHSMAFVLIATAHLQRMEKMRVRQLRAGYFFFVCVTVCLFAPDVYPHVFDSISVD